MDKNKPVIRLATPDDAQTLLAIYAPYVLHTAVTFEYDVPSVAEFTARILQTQETYPYYVAELDGKIVGYAYAHAFIGRAAYAHAAESSVYVAQDCKRRGVGRALYEALEAALQRMNICNLNACIGWPEQEDEYLTKDSVTFHSRMGFTMVGEFHNCGTKFNRWYNMVWMEKMLCEHPTPPLPILNFNAVRGDI